MKSAVPLRSVPSLDDEIEESFLGGFIMGIDEVARMTMGLMSTAPPPPSSPPKDESRDPAGVLGPAEEEVRRRIALICPSGAPHYVHMHEVIANYRKNSTPVSDLFHAARELVNAIIRKMMTVAILVAERKKLELPDEPQKGGKAAWQQEVMARVFDLDASTIEAWRSLDLHKYAHQDDVHGVRPYTPELVKHAFKAVDVVLVMLDAHEQQIEVVFDRIDEICAGEPTKPAAEELTSLVPFEQRYLDRVFDQLNNPGWWQLLAKHRFFDVLPPQQSTVHPVWGGSRYLARIALAAPDRPALINRLLVIGASTTNVRIHEDLVRIAIALPAVEATKILDAAAAWLYEPLHRDVARLAGDPEMIRFPAWLAELSLRLAVEPDLNLDEKESARFLLSLILSWEVDSEHPDGCFPVILETGILTIVVRHLLQRVGDDSWTLLLAMLITVLQDTDDALGTLIDGLEDEETDELEIESTVRIAWPVLSEAVRWKQSNSDLLRDASTIVLPEDLHAALGSPLLDESAGAECRGLVELVEAVVRLALTPPGGNTMLASSGRGMLGSGSKPRAIEQRTRLVLLAIDDRVPADELMQALMDPTLQASPSVRAEYTALIVARWPKLMHTSRSRIRDTVLASASSEGSLARAALARRCHTVSASGGRRMMVGS